MQAQKFKNFSNQDFTWKYDGVPYTFKAGQEMYLEDYKAKHFAKHLIDRELNNRGIPTNNLVEVAKLAALALPSDEVVTPMEALNIEETKKEKKGKKKVEAEFPDLEDNK